MSLLLRVSALFFVISAPLAAQGSERLRIGSIFETYRFDDGYSPEAMTQLTVPVGLQVGLGSRASFVLSTGYVSVLLHGNDTTAVVDQKVHGPLDTEMRLDVNVVSDRLVTFLAATLPTGRQTVVDEQMALLVALANDAIGFSAPSLGSGGSLSAGFSAAVPLGRLALGGAATAAYAFAYEPVLSERISLRPGAEVRIRLGIEGALASRTYLRLAGSLAARQKDQLDGVSTPGLGRRTIGYVTLEQGMGPILTAVYAFDVLRGSPQLEPTAVGAAVLPRGNLLSAGVTMTVPLGASTSLIPSVEYRVAAAASSPNDTQLHRQASSIRAGAEMRRQIRPDMSMVLRAQGAFGDVRPGLVTYGFSGFRVGASVEVVP